MPAACSSIHLRGTRNTMGRDEKIYVGYRALGRTQRRVVQNTIAALLLLGIIAGAIVATSMRPAGAGKWDSASTVTESGVLRLAPYPHLVTPSGPILLAETGKIGAQKRLEGQSGRELRVTGTLLSRGHWKAIEIESVEMLGAQTLPDAVLHSVGNAVQLRGEILDSKCFLGAMKPGDGAAHKSCAMLCLRGGIAPLFVGTQSNGEVFSAILCLPNLAPVDETIIGYAGESVKLTGRHALLDGLDLFLIDPDSIILDSD